MSNLTEEQWKQIDEKLSGAWGSVELNIDGYNIFLAVQSIKRFNQAIVVYINGKIDFSLIKESEEAKRFWQLRRRFIYPLKIRTRAKNIRNKALREDLYKNIDKTIDTYWPWWNSLKALRRHLEKNNQSIELVDKNKGNQYTETQGEIL
jgi:ribosome-associated translation inhibitor RaiA